jgi:hypothetical protein
LTQVDVSGVSSALTAWISESNTKEIRILFNIFGTYIKINFMKLSNLSK